jgi:tetratricopeptide (TPR) repeat protein/TolB-like protein
LDGEKLSDYEIHEQLGSGGMGAVYRATDRRIGRTVAVKVIRPDRLLDDTARERFTREARGIGQLNHPNIATLYDVSLDQATPHIVLEYLPGGSLEQRIRRGPMPLGELLRCAAGIASGLEHAHAHGVVHRDLKPGNILFSAGGIPKIIDFGLASKADITALTQPGTVMGTAEYMSPEQASGQPADRRSDIFSLGVILYQMASGRHPFQSDSVPATLHRIVYDTPPPISAGRADLPAAFTRMVAAMLEKRPEKRPQSLRGAVAELQSLTQSASSTGRDSTETMVVHPLPKRRRLARLAGAILLVTLLLAVAWWTRSRWMPPRLPAAQQLVVLPFENLSRDPMEQAFCDGLVELVTSTLTQMERFHSTLWVIPSADVRRLNLHSVSEAGKAFPVNLAVTGSLQTDGDQVLVIANLSDVKTTRQIGSRMIPVSRAQRSQLNTRLASALLELLDLNAGNSGRDVLRGVQPKVASANDSYLQAKGLLQHAEVPANLNKAIELLETSVRLDPAFALSHSALADAYLRRYARTKEKEWLALADAMVNRSFELDPNQAAVHLLKGRICRATGQGELAVAEIRQAIALDPLNVTAYTALALAFSDVRRPADAERAYLQAVHIRPSYWPAYSNLGVFYQQRGELAKALEPLSLVVKLAPDYADGHDALGSLFYFMERFDDAAAEYGKSLDLHPTPLAYSNRGGLYYARGDYAGARQDYRRALELDNRNPLIWGNLADTEMQIPDASSQARDDYLRAIALSREQLAVNPNDADVLGRMALYLARTANCGEAAQRIGEARRLAPDRVVLILKSARVAETCHQRQSAIRYLDSAIRKGYSRREIEQDPDFNQLRHDPAFAAVRAKTADTKP